MGDALNRSPLYDRGMDRRTFLQSGAAATAGLVFRPHTAPAAPPQDHAGPAPYRVLYSNDFTNIVTCTSPYHPPKAPFNADMLRASIDEVADTAVDAHLLQPGVGWVPLWKSRVYPIDEHYRWLKQRYNLNPDSLGRFVLDGGDVLAVFTEHCRKVRQAPIISLRLNDSHHKEFADAGPTDKQRPSGHAVNRFYDEHRDYRLGADPKDWHDRVLNWAIPAVREHKLSFLREIAENYDIDGLELDFLRHASYFRLSETSSAMRAEIMREFVAETRRLLDRTSRTGHHRRLIVRIPAYLAAHDAIGVNVRQFADAGVDLFNCSCHYFTEQQTDAPAIAARLPGKATYLEMTHTTQAGQQIAGLAGADTFSFRRTTDEQFYTTAHLARARGLTGVSLFNFVYYREHASPLRGPFQEPPFHVLKNLADASFLASTRQHWILAHVWDEPPVPNRPLGSDRKPREIVEGQTIRFHLDLAPPAGGWKTAGRLRLQTKSPLGTSRFVAVLNGATLDPADDVSEPYPSPYTSLLAPPEYLRGWTVPPTLLRDGVNALDLTRTTGRPARLMFIDLAVS